MIASLSQNVLGLTVELVAIGGIAARDTVRCSVIQPIILHR